MLSDCIIGHQEEMLYLKDILKNNKISSSYLFLGPEGIGKKSVALHFAKILNCLNQDQSPCDDCLSCKKINALNFPDLHLITPSGKAHVIKIGDIRELRLEASLKPYEGKYKVFIIDDAQTMTQESQNALLKTLEEAPGETIIILIASSLYNILLTIASRSRIIRFKAEDVNRLSSLLAENYGFKKEEALFLARYSEGRIGRALMMKEKETIQKRDNLVRRLQNLSEALTYQDRLSLKEDFMILLSYFRDIFISKVDTNNDFLFSIDRMEEIKKRGNRLSFQNLETIIEKLITLCSYIDMNVNPKLIIDAFLSELESLEVA